MPDQEIGVNSTQVPNDLLGDLLAVTKEIRDLLRQKADQESSRSTETAEKLDTNLHRSEDPPEVAYSTTSQEPLTNDTAIAEIVTGNNWPNDERIAEYKIRCAKHESECEKMFVELECFIAHLGIVGGNQRIIQSAKLLQKVLFDPVHCLERALDATPDEGQNAINGVESSFSRLQILVCNFHLCPNPKDALYRDKVEQWYSFTCNGRRNVRHLAGHGNLVECLEFIHNVFFSELETAMGGVVEALMAFEEKYESEWLVMQKIDDFESWSEKYISCVFCPRGTSGALSASPDPETVALLDKRILRHHSVCVKMRSELDHLIAHYGIVGGVKEVIEAAKLVQSCLQGHVDELKRAVTAVSDERLSAMNSLLLSLGRLYFAAGKFKGSLYHQKHAFYFREVKKWVDCLFNGLHVLHSYMHCNELDKCLDYVCNDLFTDLEMVMIGLGTVPEKTKTHEGNLPGTSSGNVAEELKMFGKESLPKFLVDQMERDTTRYVNLTTIATFFSSVTATTLQFTYAEADSVPSNSLRGVVNLFWFLSLVFSVSSGLNSLLGLTWRKSSIYDSRVPPKLIRIIFDKAPLLFLVIAAVAFVIGLNLFAYLSVQPQYVSFATNVFTVLHGMCLLVVTFWFIYQLKHKSVWVKWIGKVLQRIWDLPVWKWIGKAWKWFKDMLISSWTWTRHPRQQYRQKKLHLQRNFFWAFGIDNRVAKLNYTIVRSSKWPMAEPYLLSKLIRRIAYPIKRCWLAAKKALSDLCRAIRAHTCVYSPTRRTEDDVETGEAVAPKEISRESPAENKFRKFLQTVFSEANRVDDIMCEIHLWKGMIIMDNNPIAKQHFRRFLWGYPDLVEKLFEVMGPAVVQESEERRREREEAEQQDMKNEHAGNHNLHLAPEVGGLDKNTSIPPQASQLETPSDGSGPFIMSQTDVQPDNQGQPDCHPPSLNERTLLSASENTEALEPVSVDPNPQPNIKEGAMYLNEIKELLSTSENTNEGSRIPQSKEESGE